MSKYNREAENQEYADLCTKYEVKEDKFNYILDLKINPKKTDKMPDVFIDGNTLGHPGYYLIKMKPGDPRGLIMNGIVKGSNKGREKEAKDLTIDYMTRENNTCYIMVKKTRDDAPDIKDTTIYDKMEDNGYEILGVGYTCRSEHGNFIIDSWDHKKEHEKRDGDIVHKFITEGLAPALLKEDKNASRVLLGASDERDYFGKKLTNTLYAEHFKEGTMRGGANSYMQSLIAKSEDLKKHLDDKKAELIALKDAKFYEEIKENFVNVDHVDKFIKYYNDIQKNLAIFKEKKEKDKKNAQTLMMSYDALICHEKSLTNPAYPSLEQYAKSLNKSEKILPDSFGYIFDTEKMLVNKNARLCYEKKYFTLEELSDACLGQGYNNKNFDEYKAEYLISDDAIACYEAGYFKLSDIKNFDWVKISVLTGKDMFNCLKAGYFKFDDIKDFSENKIQKLTTPSDLELYKQGKTVKELAAVLDANIKEQEKQKEKAQEETKKQVQEEVFKNEFSGFIKKQLLDSYKKYLSFVKETRGKFIDLMKTTIKKYASERPLIPEEKIKALYEYVDKSSAIIEQDLEKYEYKMGKKGKSIKIGIELAGGFIAFIGLVVIIASISNSMNMGQSQISKLMGNIYKAAESICKKPAILGFLGAVTGVGAIIGAEKYSKKYSNDQQDMLKTKFTKDVQEFMEKNKDEIKDTSMWR